MNENYTNENYTNDDYTNDDYTNENCNDDEIILSGHSHNSTNVVKNTNEVENTEYYEVQQELQLMHYLDDQDDIAWQCWEEIQKYQKMYAVPLFNKMNFEQFKYTFFI